MERIAAWQRSLPGSPTPMPPPSTGKGLVLQGVQERVEVAQLVAVGAHGGAYSQG